jgi:hypothetical protein
MGSIGEQLLATTGFMAPLEPGPLRVTKRQLAAAAKLPEHARARMQKAVAATKPTKGEALPPFDYDRMLELLTVPLDQPQGRRRIEENVAGWPEQTLANEYAGALGRAWGYLQTQFPIRTREHLSGDENVRPPELEITRFRRTLAIVENPLAIIDRLESAELISAEVAALKAAYPELDGLFKTIALEALIDETAKQRQRDKEWNLPRRKDLMLRRLLEQPHGVAAAANKTAVQQSFAEDRAKGEQEQQQQNVPDGKLPSTDAELTRQQRIDRDH